MKINAPQIKHSSELVSGELFYHASAGAGTLCIAVQTAGNGENVKDLMIVPISYPAHPEQRNTLIRQSQFASLVIILETCFAEVVYSSAVEMSSEALVFSDGKSIFLPMNDDFGNRNGLFINMQSGQVTGSLPNSVGFKEWNIVDQSAEKEVLWNSGDIR